MDEEQLFRIFFNRHLNADLREMEMARHRLLGLLGCMAALIIALLWLALYAEIASLYLGIWLPVALLLSFGYWRIRVFKSRFKPLILTRLLQYIDPGFRYFPGEKIPKDTFVRSGLFGVDPQKYNGEDYIKGERGDLTFEVCELTVLHPSVVKGGLARLFQGVFMHVAREDASQGRLLLVPQKEKIYLGRAIKEFVRSGAMPRSGPNDDFNERFAFYMQPDAPCSHLFTPPRLQAIADFQREHRRRLYFSYIDGHYFVAQEQAKDNLEPSILRSNIDFDRVFEFYTVLYKLTGLVEELDLLD